MLKMMRFFFETGAGEGGGGGTATGQGGGGSTGTAGTATGTGTATAGAGAGTATGTQTGAATAGATGGETPVFSQAELDRRITQALQTREEKLKADMEQTRLAEAGKFEELWKKSEQERLVAQTEVTRQAFLAKHNLGGAAALFQGVPVDGLEAARTAFETTLNGEVERRVAERIKTGNPGGTTGTAGAGVVKPLGEMSTEEWKAYKAANKLY